MANKALDSNGLLYFGKEYYKKLQERFVAIESGKALSTNDYTTAEKEKLAGIETGADVNVVEDFHDLMKVLNDPNINEFQYTIEGEDWIVHLK